jgi:release factor glutamine methyltransferase
MNIQDFIQGATRQLSEAGIATARLDCLVLLEDELNTNRTQLLAHPEQELTDVQIDRLQQRIEQRAQHVPLAYLRGKTEFYGREFIVSADVLEPRPESEAMIDQLLQLQKKQPHSGLKVCDVGTGSGAVGITAALELGLPSVTLLDIDAKTLEVARQNADKHNQKVELVQNNLFNNYNADYDVLLCNLPYVPDDFEINTAALHEPRLAIFGGPDGLDLYRELFAQITKLETRPRFILTEAMPPQHDELTDIARAHSYNEYSRDDFIQVFAR